MRGGAHMGGAGSYLLVDKSGAITQAGAGTATWVGTHTFTNGVTHSGAVINSSTVAQNGVQTFAAAPVMTGSGRATHHIWIRPSDLTTATSVAQATLNSRWDSLYFTPSGSASDLTVYGQVSVPEDMDVSVGLTPRIWWSRGAAAASGIADWVLGVENVASGAGSIASASEASIAAGASLTSAVANTIVQSALSTIGAGAISKGELLSLALRLEGSDGLTTAGCPYFLGIELDYSANSL
jgi:hypothetical protein